MAKKKKNLQYHVEQQAVHFLFSFHLHSLQYNWISLFDLSPPPHPNLKYRTQFTIFDGVGYKSKSTICPLFTNLSHVNKCGNLSKYAPP